MVRSSESPSLDPAGSVDRAQHRLGDETDEFGAADRGERRDAIEDLARPDSPRGDQVARHLDAISDGEGERADLRRAERVHGGAGALDRRVGEQQVVGDEDMARADAAGTGSRARHARAAVGTERGKGVLADLWERALGTVDEAGERELGSQPIRKRRLGRESPPKGRRRPACPPVRGGRRGRRRRHRGAGARLRGGRDR